MSDVEESISASAFTFPESCKENSRCIEIDSPFLLNLLAIYSYLVHAIIKGLFLLEPLESLH